MFCRDCINPILSAVQGGNCPVCREAFTEVRDIPLALKNTMENIKWHCKHKSEGCKFTGTAKETEAHEKAGCPEAQVICVVPNCNVSMKRKALPKHEGEKKVQTKHKRLEKEEIAKLDMDPTMGTLVRLVRFPDFETRLGSLKRGDELESAHFSFQGGLFALALGPKGYDEADEGMAGLYLQKLTEVGGRMSMAVKLMGSDRSLCQMYDRSEEELQCGTGWSRFCSTDDLVSATRATPDGALEFRLRLCASSKPILPLDATVRGEGETDTKCVLLKAEKFFSDDEGTLSIATANVEFRGSEMSLFVGVDAEKEEDSTVCFTIKSDKFEGELLCTVRFAGGGRSFRIVTNMEEGSKAVIRSLCSRSELKSAVEANEGILEVHVRLQAVSVGKAETVQTIVLHSEEGGVSPRIVWEGNNSGA
uniref:TRAF-type domain-containing protein n=1 Tax=Chromera velia CCMP2878 TaxID=1169474 RepID=A0A0G4I8M2_9ALVE|eukprot:Cvel_2003.t1-p1 / transcript=Cvel_2003.t1 / gene=Cvel_2003 / organism=Chromera_velia_CCMP2878 / gene_product=hypothetical protein / transcript_product=hypothetical protein / location=Cvel_scaffold76:109355-112354(-) / protein_length=419 / sequence_SO=supercontig / SO=protein_coding / is_pseudo=false